MEIGQLFTMPEFKNKQTKNNLLLSIHIHVNGFSFFTHEATSKKASKIYHTTFPQGIAINKLHDALHTELKTNGIIGQSFKEVRCSVENNLATLVPKSLFEEKALQEYVRHDIDIRENDFVTYDIVPSADWVTVYGPFVNVNNMLIDSFGSFSYYHSVSIWLSAISKHKETDGELSWSMYKSGDRIHIALLRDTKLQFYNCFDAPSAKDIAYYVLLTAKENDISPNEVPLYLVGDVFAGDSTYKALYSFVRSLNILHPETSLIFPAPRINTHQDFCLLNLF